MAKGAYHVNEASARSSELLGVLQILTSNDERGDSQQVTIRQESDGGRYVLTAQGQVFTDLSLNRVIERAGRALTTVYER